MIKKNFIWGVIGIVLLVIFIPLYGPEVVVFGPERLKRCQASKIVGYDPVT